jgi:hypothetical protein
VSLLFFEVWLQGMILPKRKTAAKSRLRRT